MDPDDFFENDKFLSIIMSKNNKLQQVVGSFAVSGKSIYTLTEIDESISFKSFYRGTNFVIKIDKTTGQQVNLVTNFKNEDNTHSQTILNSILNSAFRETKLKQIGQRPHFFDMDKAIDLSRDGLMIWPGYKASIQHTQLGLTIAVDQTFKFISTKSVLDQMIELRQQYRDEHQWKQAVNVEFTRKSIMANWGAKKTYIIDGVDFDKNPENHMFERNGEPINIAEYFMQMYQVRITDMRQPLLMIRSNGQSNYLPPECCLLANVPESIRKGPNMRNALMKTKINPAERIRNIENVTKMLADMKVTKNWGFDIGQAPIKLSQTSVLGQPSIFSEDRVIHCNEQVLRRLSISKAKNLTRDDWIIIYHRRNERAAHEVHQTFGKACGMLKMRVENPHWIEMQDERSCDELKRHLMNYMMGRREAPFRHPIMCVAILGQETNYPMFKKVFQEFRISS